MWLLLYVLGTTLGSQLQISSDLFLNKLNMSYGINYKYNGLLHHNIHRVWIFTKVVLPKLKDVKFPDINFDPECKFVDHLKNSMAASKHVNSIRSICKSMKPIVTLLKQKELYYESAIKGILKEEIPWSLYGSGHSHTGRAFQDPVSAGQRFSHSTMRETTVCKKKALSALFPAIAGLATIAVESLNSFLQRKRNKAMASGMMAIRQDQSLAWNSLKQLQNDFLLYGKYNVAQVQDIVSMNDKRVDLPENVNVPLWDKVKVRALMSHENVRYNIMIKKVTPGMPPEMKLEVFHLSHIKKSK